MVLRYLSLVALSLTVAAPSFAAERFTAPFGGDGGQQFITRCAPGTLLTGVASLQGAYINGIAPICDGRMMAGVGGSGDRSNASCPNGSIVAKLGVWSLRSTNHLLKFVTLFCVARDGGGQTAEVTLRSPGQLTYGKDSGYPSTVLDCGSQRITGLQGRAGSSIDSLGLICN